VPRSTPAKAHVPSSPNPPIWRDPWALAAAAAVLPLIARTWGAPLGQPFADDFHFLHHAIFSPGWFDGGGAIIYWRPLSRQAYFGLLTPLLLSAPWIVALLHAAFLALASVLLYRAWRSEWPAPAAVVAASFPLLSESSRGLLLWPSGFQDLGALAFSALALHQASRRRLAAALTALAAAFLCKEIAVVTAVLLPWAPWRLELRERSRWLVASATILVAWGVVYSAVMRSAGLMFQRHLEAAPPPVWYRFAWALQHGLIDALGVGALGPRAGMGIAIAAGGLVILVLARATSSAVGRERLNRGAPWIVWGLVWFLANSATLTEVYPVWGPFRSAFGMVGLGVATVGLVSAAGPIGLAALLALRVTALLLSPGPPAAIAAAPYRQGAALDFASLTRLSRLAQETRPVLLSSHPRLAPGSIVVWRHRPLLAEHAFADDKALQVWYRDTTLRMVPWDDVLAGRERAPDAALEYEAGGPRQVVAIVPAALAAYLEGVRAMETDDCRGALAHLARAESLQVDREARAFLATVAGKRAVCRLSEGQLDDARGAALASLALWRDGSDARYVLAVLWAIEGRPREARAQLDTLLELYPFDPSARALLDSLKALEAR
jgi:tetratricopeptide (TPR) repeat protein